MPNEHENPPRRKINWRMIRIAAGILIFLTLVSFGWWQIRTIQDQVTTISGNIGTVADTLNAKIDKNASGIYSLGKYPSGNLADELARDAYQATAWTEVLFNNVSFNRALSEQRDSSTPLSQYVFDNFSDIAAGTGGFDKVRVYNILKTTVSNRGCLQVLGNVFNITAPLYFQLAPAKKPLAIQEAQTWLHYLQMPDSVLKADTTYYGKMVVKWHKNTSDEWRATALQVCGDFIITMGASPTTSARGKSPAVPQSGRRKKSLQF